MAVAVARAPGIDLNDTGSDPSPLDDMPVGMDTTPAAETVVSEHGPGESPGADDIDEVDEEEGEEEDRSSVKRKHDAAADSNPSPVKKRGAGDLTFPDPMHPLRAASGYVTTTEDGGAAYLAVDIDACKGNPEVSPYPLEPWVDADGNLVDLVADIRANRGPKDPLFYKDMNFDNLGFHVRWREDEVETDSGAKQKVMVPMMKVYDVNKRDPGAKWIPSLEVNIGPAWFTPFPIPLVCHGYERCPSLSVSLRKRLSRGNFWSARNELKGPGSNIRVMELRPFKQVV